VSCFALRTEHLAHDWDALDEALGGGHGLYVNGTVRFSTKAGTVRSAKHDTSLSEKSRKNLCYALCEDIQAYKQLLHDAINLNELQVGQSLDELISSCPEETREVRDCSTTL